MGAGQLHGGGALGVGGMLGDSPPEGGVDEDGGLIMGCRRGDAVCHRALYAKYAAKVYGFARRFLGDEQHAEDVAQEVFLRVFRKLSAFRGESRFSTWLYRIVFNMSIDLKRKKKRSGGQHEEIDANASSEDFVWAPTSARLGEPHEELDRKERAQKVSAVLQEISPEHRAVVMLREVDGLSYDEIAEVTGATKGTVMSRLFYARKRIQKALQRVLGEDPQKLVESR